MAVKEILTYPDERLKRLAEKVERFDSELRDLIADLEQTRQAGPAAVGIAAPQIGYNKRIVIVDVSGRKKTHNHGYLVLVNPEITEWEGFEVGREGCLSVPDYTGNVIRAEKISLQAYDPQGNTIKIETHGFEARAIQHELDHLDGLLFLDRLVSRRNDLFERKNYK
ncbi:MAG: peptide deformylase [Gammaproteobacteria bacterium]|nr:peptide deformylase [Gammaproteobacteria bacterium]